MGTVKGDIHIIGKSLCCAMQRGAGYTVIDLGCDVTPDDFIDEAMVNHASIIGASSLMTTTLISQKDLVREVKSSGCRCRTIVGGAPCSQEWCDRIGADAYSATASEWSASSAGWPRGRDRDHVRTDGIQWVDIRTCAIPCL